MQCQLGLDAGRATQVRAQAHPFPSVQRVEQRPQRRERRLPEFGPQLVLDRPGRCALVRQVVDPRGVSDTDFSLLLVVESATAT